MLLIVIVNILLPKLIQLLFQPSVLYTIIIIIIVTITTTNNTFR